MLTPKTMRNLAGSAAALALLLTACEKPKPRNSAAHPLPQNALVAECPPGKCGGDLRLAVSGTPRSFNPLASDAMSQETTRLLFANLTTVDWQTQKLRPALAESWQVAADSRSWTFKLRQGVRWSDGHLLTADDVIFTWNDVIYAGKASEYLAEVFSIKGTNFAVTKLDDLTVQVVTPEVFPPFLEFFGNVAILPKHILEKPAATNPTGSPFSRIACSGPFRPTKVNPDSSVVLERNPEYWAVDKAGQRLPYFDHVILFVEAQPLQAVVNGRTDAYDRVPRTEQDLAQSAADRGKIQLLNAGVGAERDILWFNQNTNRSQRTGKLLVEPARLRWFREQKFRQAVSLAINRDRIVRDIHGGRAEPGNGLLGSENKFWNNVNLARAEFNPAKASAWLAEIGLQDRNHDGVLEDADGNKVEFSLLSNLGNATRLATAKLIVEDLVAVGIKANLQAIPFSLLSEHLNLSQDYECVLLGLGGGGLDPASSVNALLSSSPACQWFPGQPAPSSDWEARLDSLIRRQSETLDPTARKQAFDEVQTLLVEQLPMIYIASPQTFVAVSKDLGNVRPSALTPYRATWNVEELYRK